MRAFQALIGTVETNAALWLPLLEYKVSSPHRYCRNCPPMYPGSADFRVSSPHRYCRNVAALAADVGVPAFQALIGTVETRTTCWPPGRTSTFQALIGTVETRRGAVDRAPGAGFQALIGTVETLDSGAFSDPPDAVSSPHRYCRNPSWGSGQRGCGSRFQALIGTVETDLGARGSRALGDRFKPS